MLKPLIFVGLLLGAISLESHAAAQCAATATSEKTVQILPPTPVWPKGAPDLGDWPGRSVQPVRESVLEERVFNVTEPSLQAFLPDPRCATGAAVIVAPGGGFRMLSIRNEGTEVAMWLAKRGVAAFVLKYRLWQNPVPSIRRPANQTLPDYILGQPGVADGRQALNLLRHDAARYGLDPARIGAIGFSAGGHVVSMMTLDAPPAERPSFVAAIYGGPFLSKFPPLPPASAADQALPPFFLAVAQDDALAAIGIHPFHDALRQAGYRPEAHFYRRGGHGFGMTPQGGTSDHFIQEFLWWMDDLGMTSSAPKPKTAP